MRDIRRVALLGPAVVLLVLNAPIIAHDGPHTGPDTASFKVARNGDVSFPEDLRISEVLVRKGKYKFAHQLDGEAHIVTLTRVGPDAVDVPVYEASTRVMPGRGTRTASVLRAREAADHSLRIGIIEVQGESGDHIPPPRIGTS